MHSKIASKYFALSLLSLGILGWRHLALPEEAGLNLFRKIRHFADGNVVQAR